MNMDELRKMGNFTSPTDEKKQIPQMWWQDRFWKGIALAILFILAAMAAENNDTTFNYRNMFLSVDSTLQVDWGSEEQVISKVYQNDGVITQDYEWRKYGLIITIQRDSRRVRMDYTFRDKDNSVSVLQGSVIGNEGDTLFLRGDYMAKREIDSLNGTYIATSGVAFWGKFHRQLKQGCL